jgi:pyruvate dehydrogenase E2 component (dihydrolipoamide acetyltransferase)
VHESAINFIEEGEIMAHVVNMPQIGLNEESNMISSWHKEVGDKVSVGDTLFSIETDKSSMDVESEFEGVLLKKFYDEWDACEVLTPVCIIGEEGEDVSGYATSAEDKPAESKPEEDEKREIQAEPIHSEAEKEKTETEFAGISPRAKNLAKKQGLDFELAEGSGPYGRIIERDIYKLMKEGPSATKALTLSGKAASVEGTGIGGKVVTADIAGEAEKKPIIGSDENEYSVEKLSNIRKIISANMMASLQNTAQLTLNASFDASQILNYRKIVKESSDEDIAKITLNDMVMYSVAKTVNEFSYLNAHLVDDELRLFKDVNLGFACDSPRGLMVPTVMGANNLSLLELSKSVKTLAGQCQQGNIDPAKLQSATFTVTNLGNLGIENFTPVINPPQTGILGIGKIDYKIRKTKDGFENYPGMYLSLTIDHRAVDGAPGARFIQELIKNLENFSVLLAR